MSGSIVLINPYRLAATGPTDWGPYADFATAEASGDGWGDGDTIQITGGPDFLYYSALKNAGAGGHSGLVHKYPFNDGQVFDFSNLYVGLNEATTDPDDWVSAGDAFDVSTNNYIFDVSGGFTRHVEDNNLGQAALDGPENEAFVGGNYSAFTIWRNVKFTSAWASASGIYARWYLYGRYDATQVSRASIEWRGSDGNVQLATTAGSIASSQLTATLQDAMWWYIDGPTRKVSLWFNDDTTPDMNVTDAILVVPGTALPNTNCWLTRIGYKDYTGGNPNCIVYHKGVVIGTVGAAS